MLTQVSTINHHYWHYTIIKPLFHNTNYMLTPLVFGSRLGHGQRCGSRDHLGRAPRRNSARNRCYLCKHISMIYPRCSMHGIFTYISVIFRANVGKDSIHGAYGIYHGYMFLCYLNIIKIDVIFSIYFGLKYGIVFNIFDTYTFLFHIYIYTNYLYIYVFIHVWLWMEWNYIIYFGRMYMSNWQNYCNTNFVFASPWPVRGVGNYPFHPFPLCRSSRAGQWQDGNLLWFVVNCIRQTPSNPMKTHLNPIGMVHHLWC